MIGMAIAVLRESHRLTGMTALDPRAPKVLDKLAVVIFSF